MAFRFIPDSSTRRTKARGQYLAKNGVGGIRRLGTSMPDRSGRCPDIDASDQNKNQRDHQCGRDSAKVEYVDVSQDRSLRLDDLADQRHRLSGGVGRGRTVSGEIMGHLLHGRMENWRARRSVFNQPRLMESSEMPMLPPRLRETFINAEAWLVLAGGRPSYAPVLIGMNKNGRPTI